MYAYGYIYVYIIIYIYVYIYMHKHIQNVLGPDGLSLQFLCKAWNEMQVTKDVCKSSFCQLWDVM